MAPFWDVLSLGCRGNRFERGAKQHFWLPFPLVEQATQKVLSGPVASGHSAAQLREALR